MVTGASRRIGAAIASALAGAGANLIIHSRVRNPDADALAEGLRNSGIRTETTHHDLTRVADTESWFRKVASDFGPLDILVNSASFYETEGYHDLSEDSLRRSMALHVLSPLAMMGTMALAGRAASVVNILDSRIADGDPGHAGYHLAKRSLHTITRDLALECAPLLRINAVAPGVILPPANKAGDWLERMASTNPLKTHGSTDDVARAVIFLLSSPFITGQVIFVDGGRHLKGNLYG